ncbi:MAG TPA: hypothetical protein VK864_02010 [Longimicrobiales bacterium]|nr:hypothetical protein [Longimicrobiales bacterium]
MSEPVALHDRAAENLRYIRETMERAGSFTAVPGWGGVLMGVSAVVAAWVASTARATVHGWLRVWLIELVVALVLGGAGLRYKARRNQVSLLSGSARKFALSMLPALLVGGLLTIAFVRWGVAYSLPAIWMLLYGAGIAAAGTFSVRIVPLTGGLFMAAGAATLFLPAAYGDAAMAVAFGGFHMVFGWLIARRYGG